MTTRFGKVESLRINGVEYSVHGVDYAAPGSEHSGAFVSAYQASGSFELDAEGADAVAKWLREIERLEEAERQLQRVAARITARARENAKAPAVRGHRVTTPNAETLVRLAHLRRRIARQPQ